jgi:hypothetical protein
MFLWALLIIHFLRVLPLLRLVGSLYLQKVEYNGDASACNGACPLAYNGGVSAKLNKRL